MHHGCCLWVLVVGSIICVTLLHAHICCWQGMVVGACACSCLCHLAACLCLPLVGDGGECSPPIFVKLSKGATTFVNRAKQVAVFLVLWVFWPKKEIGDCFIEHAVLFLNVVTKYHALKLQLMGWQVGGHMTNLLGSPLWMVTMSCIVTVRQWCMVVVALPGLCGWEDSCQLFIAPKLNTSKHQCLIWVQQGYSILNWCWFTLF